MTRVSPESIYLEEGQRRVFACSLEWPGWCRSAQTEQAALAALTSYADRYAEVAALAGVGFAPGPLSVVERLPGNATTDFGAPSAIATADRRQLTAGQASRLSNLLAATWTYFDRVAVDAPAELRKGPRGGGRDRDKIVDHVVDAEAAYVRKIGLKVADRQRILTVFASTRTGTPLAERGWPARYAVRRIAWHTLDHAWEIEDRSV